MTKYIVEEVDNKKRLDLFLNEKLTDKTRSYIQKLIKDGLVFVDGEEAKSGCKLKYKQEVSVCEREVKELEVQPENIDIDIVYEDDDLAVINKPKGLVVHPGNGNENGTLVNALLFHLKNLSAINGVIRPGIVHRIDKDTSGLLLVAKNDTAHVNLAKQIELKTCHRYYVALCEGVFKNDEGVIKTGFGRSLKDRKQMAVFPIGTGKYAETHYKVLERFNNFTFVEFKLQTGRTHQIRVHCKSLNHPIVGDEVYGFKNKQFKTNGQLLHAYKIEFTHPSTNELMEFKIDFPEDLKSALNKLRNTLN